MSEAKWTKGPWKRVTRGNQAGLRSVIVHAAGSTGNQAVVWRDMPSEETLANFQLIARAPMLYEALAHVLSDLENQIVPGKAAIEAALRQARGEK